MKRLMTQQEFRLLERIADALEKIAKIDVGQKLENINDRLGDLRNAINLHR